MFFYGLLMRPAHIWLFHLFFIFYNFQKEGGWERKWWMIKGRAAPAKYTSKTPCGWGQGTAGECRGSQRHWPGWMDSGLWLSAAKKKRHHTHAHTLSYTQVHFYTGIHTEHTNEETVPTLLPCPPAHPPSLHLGTASPMSP